MCIRDRYNLELDNEYNQRLGNTPCDNHCKNIIQIYSSFLFRVKASRDFGAMADEASLVSFIKDADLDGNNFNNVIKQAQNYSSIYGHCFMILDKPNIQTATRAEELNQELISFGSYVRMCESHFYSGRIDSTFFYLEKITTLTEQLQIPFMVLLSNYYSGRYHFYNGDHKSSVEHFNFIIENIPDDFDLSMRVVPKAFNAINYKNMDQPKRSLEYMDMIKNEIGKDDKFEEMEYYNILIQALEKNNEQDLAKKYLLDAYDIIMQRSFKIKDRQLRNEFLEKNYKPDISLDEAATLAVASIYISSETKEGVDHIKMSRVSGDGVFEFIKNDEITKYAADAKSKYPSDGK